MSDCSNWRGDQIKATVEQEFRERRSEDSGARSVRGRQPERMLRVIAETTERVDVFRTRRVRTCLSLSVNKIHPSLHEPTLSASFLPYELCYSLAQSSLELNNATRTLASVLHQSRLEPPVFMSDGKVQPDDWLLLVDAYRTSLGLSDAQILLELPRFLAKEPRKWFTVLSSHVTSWTQFCTLLRPCFFHPITKSVSGEVFLTVYKPQENHFRHL